MPQVWFRVSRTKPGVVYEGGGPLRAPRGMRVSAPRGERVSSQVPPFIQVAQRYIEQ